MFSINFLPDSRNKYDKDTPLSLGKIVIGDFEEIFESSTEFWDTEKYYEHWTKAIRRLLEGETKSSLITSITDPRISNFIVWWPIYIEHDTAIFHNQILFLDGLDSPFNPDNPFAHIEERTSLTEDGNPISEWQISIADLKEFINKV